MKARSCMLVLLVACSSADRDGPVPVPVRPVQEPDHPATRLPLGRPMPHQIYFGWDSPAVTHFNQDGYLSSAQLDRMVNQLPFDGYVVHSDATTIFSYDSFPAVPVDPTLSGRWGSKDIFLVINASAPAEWDWMNDSDWQRTEANVRVMARAIAQNGLKGLWFDNETYWDLPGYSQDPWAYWCTTDKPSWSCLPARQRGLSFQAVAAKVRERGHAFAKILHEEAPKAVLAFSWAASWFAGYDLASLTPDQLDQYLSTLGFKPDGHAASDETILGYSLLLPFLQGVLQPQDDDTIVGWVDGAEVDGYYATNGGHYRDIIQSTKDQAALFGTSKTAYEQNVYSALAIYDDYLRAMPDDCSVDLTHTSPMCSQPLATQLDYITDRVYYSADAASADLRHHFLWYYSEGEPLIEPKLIAEGSCGPHMNRHPDEVIAAISAGRDRYIHSRQPNPLPDLPAWEGMGALFCPKN